MSSCHAVIKPFPSNQSADPSSRSLAGIVGSNAAEGMDGLITRPEESYRVWSCGPGPLGGVVAPWGGKKSWSIHNAKVHRHRTPAEAPRTPPWISLFPPPPSLSARPRSFLIALFPLPYQKHGQAVALYSYTIDDELHTVGTVTWQSKAGQICVHGTHSSPKYNFRNVQTWLKRLGHGIDHTPPSSFGAKNEWSHTSIPPARIHGMDSDDFTSIFTELSSWWNGRSMWHVWRKDVRTGFWYKNRNNKFGKPRSRCPWQVRSMSPRHGASSSCGWRNGLRYGG